MAPEKMVAVLAIVRRKHRATRSRQISELQTEPSPPGVGLALLPLTDWAWGRGLQIWRLGILNAPQGSLPTLPECLRNLFCDDNRLTSLTPAQVPQLEILDCRSQRTDRAGPHPRTGP